MSFLRGAWRDPRWIALVVVVLGLLAWAVVLTSHVLAVRSDLTQAKATAARLRGDLERTDVAAARRDGDLLARRTAAARRSSGGRLWRWASHVPVVGPQLAGVRTLTVITDDLSRFGLAPTERALVDLQAKPPVSAGRIDLARISSLSGTVTGSLASLRQAHGRLVALQPGHLLGTLKAARATLLSETDDLITNVVPLQRALAVAPAMLGADGRRTYFVAVQNPSESRGTGGLITGYAVVGVSGGQISVERSGTNRDFTMLLGGSTFPQTYAAMAAGGMARAAVTQHWIGATIVPDWPSASATVARLWQAQTGEKIDGVVGVDPTTIQRILAATGPVTLADGTSVSGSNASHYMEVDQYAHVTTSTDALRKDANSQLAALALGKLTAAHLSLDQIRHALVPSLKAGDILMTSLHPAEQTALAAASVAGTMPAKGAFLEVTSNNITSGKMDAFVGRSVSAHRVGPAEDVTIRVENMAGNTSALSPIQTLRLDDRSPAAPLGSTRSLITVYLGTAGHVGSVEVDGVRTRVVTGVDAGHPYAMVDLVLAPGVVHLVTVSATDAVGPLTYKAPPLARAETLDLAG